MNCEMDTYMLYKLHAQWITPEKFHPFGQVILADVDGKAYDASDAQLELHRGIPRFYIMRLQNRGRKFSTITRHQKCTQCLGSLEGRDWLIAVASPNTKPDIDDITAFRVPGNCFIKLEVGTWHAGPYFDANYVDFYNLELSDTNINDHETCNLLESYSVSFEII